MPQSLATREAWLNYVTGRLASWFEDLDAPLPPRLRIAIGFTSGGRRGKSIGECWDNANSADGTFEVFIRPDLAHSADAMPAQIAAILIHELVHAAVGIPAGHKAPFRRVAQALGLVGPMRATTAGPELLERLAPILDDAGPLPHARLETGGATTSPKKQPTRMIKCECRECGYTIRTARKWLESAGAPICPHEGHGQMQHEPLGEEGEEIDEGEAESLWAA